MKLYKLITAFVLFLSISYCYSQNENVQPQYRETPNISFSYGERLTFDINYGFVTAAEAFMNIAPAPVVINGRDCYDVSLEVNTRSTFEIVFKVRDVYKSYIDSKGIFPWKFEQHIRETNFNKDFEINFNQDSGKAITKTNFAEIRNFDVPQYVQDLISSFYYMRTLNYGSAKEGDVFTVNYFSDDKVVPMNVRFGGREDIDVSAGEFKTFILSPQLSEGFTNKTSDITIWLTDDDRKIPVKVRMKIVIGALTAELTQYTGLNGPLNSKIGD
jgi:hypothetical protein